MITTNINYDHCSCSTKNAPELAEVKTIGIFEQMRETDEVLTEIMCMLDAFKRAIRNYPIPKDEQKVIEPECFRDAVTMVNEKALAIRGDLGRIIGEFH